jgi:hypothetical protein
MRQLGVLLCGNGGAEGIAKNALDQLSNSICSFSDKAGHFLDSEVTDDTLTFGPFCARVLLENACAALVGRLDSFRMLYLSEFQTKTEYKLEKRAKSAFAWTGDIIPDEKSANSLWHIDNELPKISRALFSMHFDHIYWRPAVDKMLDYVSGQPSNPAWADLVALDADSYINETKGRCAQLYSTLSKGVHWEFFTSALLFDESTVKSGISDTFAMVSRLGLISHFIPTAYASLPPEDALGQYTSFKTTRLI